MMSPDEARAMLCSFIREYAKQIMTETSGAECVADNKILMYIAESLGLLTDDLFEARAEAIAKRISGNNYLEE